MKSNFRPLKEINNTELESFQIVRFQQLVLLQVDIAPIDDAILVSNYLFKKKKQFNRNNRTGDITRFEILCNIDEISSIKRYIDKI